MTPRHLCSLLGLIVLASIPALLTAGPQVSVVLDDGRILKGELLGQDKGVLVLAGAAGKAQDIEAGQVKHLLGADGQALDLDPLAGAASQPAALSATPQSVLRPAAPAKPMDSAAVLMWTGGGLALVGGVFAAQAGSQDGGASLSGGTGVGAIALGGIGLVGLTVGILMHFHHPGGPAPSATALLLYQHGRWSLGLPPVAVSPQGLTRATLAQAEF